MANRWLSTHAIFSANNTEDSLNKTSNIFHDETKCMVFPSRDINYFGWGTSNDNIAAIKDLVDRYHPRYLLVPDEDLVVCHQFAMEDIPCFVNSWYGETGERVYLVTNTDLFCNDGDLYSLVNDLSSIIMEDGCYDALIKMKRNFYKKGKR